MKGAERKRRRRRRTCYDRLRMWILKRRKIRMNPAQLAAQQLATLFLAVFTRIPVPEPVALRYTPPPMSPRHVQRIETARRLAIPPRYVDIMLAQGAVPYDVLFHDIRRGGVSRRDALIVLGKRVPEPSFAWLKHIEQWGLWSELLRCYIPKGLEEDTDTRILKATLLWVREKSDRERHPEPTLAPETRNSLGVIDGGENPAGLMP